MSAFPRSCSVALCLLLAAGCDGGEPVNAPTDPALPVEVPETMAADNPASILPGRGASSFVGRWAADVAWCAGGQGEQRPIDITATRFEGYENSCAIAAVDEVRDGYVATLACVSEGEARTGRVRMSVTGDIMRMTWLDEGGPTVTLRQCTTLTDTDPKAPAL